MTYHYYDYDYCYDCATGSLSATTVVSEVIAMPSSLTLATTTICLHGLYLYLAATAIAVVVAIARLTAFDSTTCSAYYQLSAAAG